VLHDEIGCMLLGIEVKRMVFDDGGMLYLLHTEEVFFELKDVLFIHRNYLDCIHFLSCFVFTALHNCICSLSYFLEDCIFLMKSVDVVLFLFRIFFREPAD